VKLAFPYSRFGDERFGRHSVDIHQLPPLIVFHAERVARRRAARIVWKHSSWPVPSYGLREALSKRLVKGGESLDERRSSLRDNTLRNRLANKGG
jgi:hypothetical protein